MHKILRIKHVLQLPLQLHSTCFGHNTLSSESYAPRMANFTVNNDFRPTNLNETIHPRLSTVTFYLLLSTLNIFLSITALLGNVLILIALHTETSLHPPTKLLFRCLAITDLCVGVIAQPVYAFGLLHWVTTEINRQVHYYVDMLWDASSFILCLVSIFTSSAVSVDRLLALLSGLRYRHVVTFPRVSAVIICFWLIGIACVLIYLWSVT